MNIVKLFLFLFITLSLNANEQKLEHVKLQLQWKHQFEFAGFYAAKEKGFYKDLGLDVEFIEFDASTDIVGEVVSGKANYGVTSSSIIADYFNGKPVVLLANFFKQSPLVLVTQEEIKSLSDLKNKNIMGVSKNINHLSLLAMLDKAGVKHKDIIEVPTSFNMDDFIERKVDAVSIFTTNELYTLTKKNIKFNLFDPLSYGAKYYDENLFTTKKEVLNHPLRAKKFRDASIKGWIYALKNQEEMVDIILKKYNTQNRSKESLLFEARQTYQIMLPDIHNVGNIDINLLQVIADSFAQSGFIKNIKSKDIKLFIYDYKKNLLKLTDKEMEFIKNHPIIKVANEDDWAPFDFSENGKAKGYSIDIVRSLAQKVGIKLEFVNGYSWEELLKQFENGRIDMMPVLTKTAYRVKKFSYSEPYMKWQGSYFIRNDEQSIKSTKDFDGKKIAAVKGWSSTAIVKQKYPKAIVVEYKNVADLLMALSLKKVDVAIGTISSVTYTMMQELIINIKLGGHIDLGNDDVDDNLYFASKKNAPELVSIFSKALKLLSVEEKIDLQKKWFGIIIDDNLKKTSIGFTKEELTYLKNKKEIKICVDPAWMPFSAIIDDKYVGIDADFMKLFENRLNIPIRVHKTDSWNESIKAVKANKCDLLTMVVETPERKKYLNFTMPYFYFSNVIVTKKDKRSVIDIGQLKNKKIAIIRSYAEVELIKNEYPSIEVVEVDSIKEGLNKVESSELYGFVDNAFTVDYYFQNADDSKFKIRTYFDEKSYLRLGVRDDDLVLYTIFQKVLESISYQENYFIEEKWFGLQYKKVFDYTLFYKFLILLIIIAFFASYKHYTTKKLYKKLKKRVEEEVKKSREKDKMLFQQNKLASMGEMLENIAHQWRQPLSQINSSVLIIDDILDDNNFKNIIIEEKLSEIESLTKYLSNTIDDFKDFFAQDKQKKLFNLRDTVEKALHIVKGNFQKYRIDTLLFIDENLTYYSYENELQQVIVVILNNAKDAFIERNTLHPIIKISLEKKDNFYALTICDNAGGITKAVEEKIFEPYFTTKHKSQGVGIGLYMSKKIVHDSLNGELSITNSEVGACFKIKLEIDSE